MKRNREISGFGPVVAAFGLGCTGIVVVVALKLAFWAAAIYGIVWVVKQAWAA